MPTERRLMNKKAFEEMELLEIRCRDENAKRGLTFKPVLELNESGEEVFSVIIMNKGVIDSVLSAKNYTEIEKKFTRYVNGL